MVQVADRLAYRSPSPSSPPFPSLSLSHSRIENQEEGGGVIAVDGNRDASLAFLSKPN